MPPQPIRILFAEDEQFLRELMTRELQTVGYLVEAVSSADEALAALRAGTAPDILLTDINMPGTLDGWALAETCRNLHSGLHVIYTTSGPQDVARRLRGSQFVAKPYQLEAIVTAIHRIVSEGAEGSARLPAPDTVTQ